MLIYLKISRFIRLFLLPKKIKENIYAFIWKYEKLLRTLQSNQSETQTNKKMKQVTATSLMNRITEGKFELYSDIHNNIAHGRNGDKPVTYEVVSWTAKTKNFFGKK